MRPPTLKWRRNFGITEPWFGSPSQLCRGMEFAGRELTRPADLKSYINHHTTDEIGSFMILSCIGGRIQSNQHRGTDWLGETHRQIPRGEPCRSCWWKGGTAWRMEVPSILQETWCRSGPRSYTRRSRKYSSITVQRDERYRTQCYIMHIHTYRLLPSAHNDVS
jgi:hypothetical protein